MGLEKSIIPDKVEKQREAGNNYSGFVHFDISGDYPTLIMGDGLKYDKKILIASVQDVLKKFSFKSREDQGNFRMLCCSMFCLPTEEIDLSSDGLVREVSEKQDFYEENKDKDVFVRSVDVEKRDKSKAFEFPGWGTTGTDESHEDQATDEDLEVDSEEQDDVE